MRALFSMQPSKQPFLVKTGIDIEEEGKGQ